MIIVLSGKARSGKDTIADYICNNYVPSIKVSFAEPLKAMCKKYFGFSNAELNETKTAESRKVMQGLGMLVRGEVDPNFWINLMRRKIFDYNMNCYRYIVVSDCRFVNELNLFDTIYYDKVVKIRVNRAQGKVEYGADTPSETELDNITNWDYVIENNFDLAHLYDKVNTIIQEKEK